MDELEAQLLMIAAYLETEIKNQLLENGHKATGQLIESISNTVSRGSNMFVIEGSMAKQGAFVISGRAKGLKGVPIDALVNWIKAKNFSTTIKSTRGLAFAIQKSIKEKGIKPDDFIGDTFEKNRNRISRDVEQAIEKSLDFALTNLVNNAKQFI